MHSTYVSIHFGRKNDYDHFLKKDNKNNIRIISKQYVHIQTMTSTPVKLQRNRSKTVGVVAYTMYPLLEGERKDGKPNTMSTKGGEQ